MSHRHRHRKSSQDTYSRLGASLSVLCSIHCLSVPFLVAFLPMAGGALLTDPLVEAILMGSSILLAGFTLVRDYRRHHGRLTALSLLAVGFVFILAELLTSSHSHSHLLAPVGGILIFMAYLANWHHSRQYHSCSTH